MKKAFPEAQVLDTVSRGKNAKRWQRDSEMPQRGSACENELWKITQRHTLQHRHTHTRAWRRRAHALTRVYGAGVQVKYLEPVFSKEGGECICVQK